MDARNNNKQSNNNDNVKRTCKVLKVVSSRGVKSKEKCSSRLERLRRRMEVYRGRSRELESVEQQRNNNNDNMNNGFNMFCREFNDEPREEKNQEFYHEVAIPFDESYFFTGSCDAEMIEESLCWICGQKFRSSSELTQHASTQHFSEWLSSTSSKVLQYPDHRWVLIILC